MKKGKKIAAAVALAGLLAFIWGHSMMPRAASAQESAAVLGWLRPVLAALFGEENVTVHLVRKLAHLAEYGALGLLLWWNLTLSCRWSWRLPVLAVRLGLYTALADETIQIFSGRGPQIQDLWLDLSGVCAGLAAAAVLTLAAKEISKRKKRQKG